MTIMISVATVFVYHYPETEEFRRCECIRDYTKRVQFVKYINDTCPYLPIDLDCFKYIGHIALDCIDTSKWFYVFRFVLNVEAILNIMIAVVVWRSPYLPNLVAFFCCFSTILSSYVNQKWFALIGELMTFIGTYVMLFYGIFSHLKIS